MKSNLVTENIRISLHSIRSHLLRTVLTILIIAFGIMALVGILTAIDSIKSTITKQFATMGANTFSIESRGFTVQIGKSRYRKKNHLFSRAWVGKPCTRGNNGWAFTGIGAILAIQCIDDFPTEPYGRCPIKRLNSKVLGGGNTDLIWPIIRPNLLGYDSRLTKDVVLVDQSLGPSVGASLQSSDPTRVIEMRSRGASKPPDLSIDKFQVGYFPGWELTNPGNSLL